MPSAAHALPEREFTLDSDARFDAATTRLSHAFERLERALDRQAASLDGKDAAHRLLKEASSATLMTLEQTMQQLDALAATLPEE